MELRPPESDHDAHVANAEPTRSKAKCIFCHQFLHGSVGDVIYKKVAGGYSGHHRLCLKIISQHHRTRFRPTLEIV